MKTPGLHKIRSLIICLVFLLTACNGANLPDETFIATLPAVPTQDLHGLSPDAFKTLNSLEKIHDYPFYVMHYFGDYQYPRIRASVPTSGQFSCSLFASLSGAGDMFYGRNFDWEFSPSMLLFTYPFDGYASVSMVDLEFLDISPAASKTLLDLPVYERQSLLTAPAMPFDGMNEYGLTIGMAALPDEFLDDASDDPSRPSIGSIGIIRQVLDHARNVDEAVKLFEKYNIEFTGGPAIHYLLADRSGKAVLIEYYQGQMVVLANEGPWHMATNHLRCIARGDGGCSRYRTLSRQLSAANGLLNPVSAMQALSDVSQENTQWSSVYNMSTGDINIAVASIYDQVFSFHLEIEKQ